MKFFILLFSFLIFGTDPFLSLIISSFFVFFLIYDSNKEIENGYFPILQFFVLLNFIQYSLSLNILEVMFMTNSLIDPYYLRAVSFTEINFLSFLCLFFFYLGCLAVPLNKRGLLFTDIFYYKKYNKYIFLFFFIIKILQYFNISAIAFPLSVLNVFFLLYSLMNISFSISFKNPFIYLIAFSFLSDLSSGMIGNSLNYFFFFIFFLGTFHFKLIKSKLSNPIYASVFLLSLFSLLYTVAVFQTVKFEIRKKWANEIIKSDNIFSLAYEDVKINNHTTSDYFINLLYRLNQSSLTSETIKMVPNVIPFEDGRTLVKAFYDALTIRLFKPNKEQSGGREKFEKYTGRPLVGYTSMNIGIVGEAYVNFSYFFSFLFFFFLGFSFSKTIVFIGSFFSTLETLHIFVLKITFIFIYFNSFSDFQMLFNSIIKGIIVLYFIYFILNKVSSISKV